MLDVSRLEMSLEVVPENSKLFS